MTKRKAKTIEELFITFETDAEIVAALNDAARGEGLAPEYALPLAVSMIRRLEGRIRVLEATLNGRFLGEEAAE